MTARLQIKHGPQTGSTIPLSTAVAKFSTQTNGSDTPCFEIENRAGGYIIKPLPDGLPAFLNGRQVTQSYPLKDGDEIALPPEMIFVYRQPNQTMAASRKRETKVQNQENGVPGWLIWIGLLLLINLLSAIFDWPFWVW